MAVTVFALMALISCERPVLSADHQVPQSFDNPKVEPGPTVETSQYVYIGVFLDRDDRSTPTDGNRVYCHVKRGEQLWCSDPSKVPIGLGPLESFEVVHNYLACAIPSQGTPLCWNPQTMVRFTMKPAQKGRFVKVVAAHKYFSENKDQDFCAWGLTEDGKIDHFGTIGNFNKGSGYKADFVDDFNARFSAKDIALDLHDQGSWYQACGLFAVTTDKKPVINGDLSEETLKNGPTVLQVSSFPSNGGFYHTSGYCFEDGSEENLGAKYCPVRGAGMDHVKLPGHFRVMAFWDTFRPIANGIFLKQCGVTGDGTLECYAPRHTVNGAYPTGKSVGNMSMYGSGMPHSGFVHKVCVPTEKHIECINVLGYSKHVEILPYGMK